MVAQKHSPYVTPQEYLEWEERSETKSEYHDGVIVAMSGASPEHNKITFDLTVVLGSQLRNSRCQGFTSDLRVHIPTHNRYFYPDVVITCDDPQFENIAGVRSLLNPTLLIEVLSESTEREDRGDKFFCYQSLPSLVTYVLVAQNRPRIETYTRQADGSWKYDAFNSLEAVVPLEAIDCTVCLADVYARISFPSPTNRPMDMSE